MYFVALSNRNTINYPSFIVGQCKLNFVAVEERTVERSVWFWRPVRIKKEKSSPCFPMFVVNTVLVLVGRQQKWVRLGDHLPLPMPKTGVE